MPLMTSFFFFFIFYRKKKDKKKCMNVVNPQILFKQQGSCRDHL